MNQKDQERLKYIFEKEFKIFKNKKGHVTVQGGLDYNKRLEKLRDPFKRIKNRAIDYFSGSRSYIWSKLLKDRSLSKYVKYALRTKIEAPFYAFGVINDIAYGEKPLQAFVSSSVGFGLAFALSEPLGPLGIIAGPEIYELANDAIDAGLFGDKKKQQRFKRIGSKINNLLLNNQKTFSKAANFFAPVEKAAISGVKGAAKLPVIGNIVKWIGSLFGKKLHSGGVVPGRGEVMAILKGGETVRTEEQERAIQEALMRRYTNPEENNKKERNSKESLLPRLSKEDDQYIIGLIADAYKRNRYGFRTLLRS